jgi:hypothetical protein
MSNANRQPRPHPDPVVTALRRLMNETDRTIAAAEKVRQARIELAKLLENNAVKTEGQK